MKLYKNLNQKKSASNFREMYYYKNHKFFSRVHYYYYLAGAPLLTLLRII